MQLTARAGKSWKGFVILFGAALLALALAPRRAAAGGGNAPVPFIEAISPVSVAPGGAAFTLTVTGANFVATSQVYWGTTQLTTTLVSSGKLTATVPTTLTASSGTGWITVVTPAPGGGKSNLLFLPVIGTVPSLSFTQTAYSGANGSWGTIAGDFNNDGKLDVVTSDRGGHSVTMFLGNGDGTFQAGQVILVAATFNAPFGVAVGDINNDGNLDLVVTALSAGASGGIAVLLGNGDGTFQTPVVFTNDHGSAAGLALADVNGDGKLDLLVGLYAGGAGQGIEVYLGNGDGTFQVPVLYSASLGNVGQVVVADMNGDGKLDMVVTDEARVAILLGNGDGTFQTPVSQTLGGAIGLVVADFDGDGKLDVAANAFPTAVDFLKGNGDGTLQAPVSIGTGSNRALQAGDFNGDGKLDLVAQDSNQGTLDFYLGNGDGTFQTVQAFGTGVGPMYYITVGNFAAGAGLAVAAADNSTHMLFFTPAVTVSPATNNFGSVAIGANSATQTFTVTNGTPVSVTISSVTIAETGSSVDFQLGAATCNGALAVNATCTIDVTFIPTVAGALSATLQVNDNGPGSPQTATLSGTGTAAPAVLLSSASLTFVAQGVGTTSTAQMVTLTNNGTASLSITNIAFTGTNNTDYGQTNNCIATLAVSATCTFNVTFTPNASGARSASLTITDNAPGSPHSVTLTGTGQLLPTASLSVNTLTFAATLSGASSTSQMVTVTNNGGTALAISSIALSGTNAGDFMQTNGCGTSLAASANCAITVTFKPTAGGARIATVTLTDNATGSPQSIALSGTGQDYTLNATTSTQTISPGGTANFQIAVTPQGGFASVVTLTCTGAPLASTCMVTPSSFTPTGAPTTVAVSVVTRGQLFAPPAFLSLRYPRQPMLRALADSAFLCFLVLLAFVVRFRRGDSFTRLTLARPFVIYSALLLAAMCGLAGCGSAGIAKGSYPLTITATSGAISHSTTITVVVQ